MKNDKEIMNEEIKSRLESDSWDLAIANKVIEMQKTKFNKANKVWSVVPLATAAMSLIIFTAGIFYTFSSAAEGSDDLLLSYSFVNIDESFNNDIITAEVEWIINEAYPMR